MITSLRSEDSLTPCMQANTWSSGSILSESGWSEVTVKMIMTILAMRSLKLAMLTMKTVRKTNKTSVTRSNLKPARLQKKIRLDQIRLED